MVRGVDVSRLPARVQARLATAGATAQANADQVNDAMDLNKAALSRLFTRAQDSRLPPQRRLEALRAMADIWMEPVAAHSACRAGCSHCCHIPVTLSTTEAQLIAAETGVVLSGFKGRKRAGGNPEKPGYGNPCPFLSEGRCSIYAHRPLICRTHLNMDEDPLLCELVEDASVPVPYANATFIQAAYLGISRNQRFGDIREFFGKSLASRRA